MKKKNKFVPHDGNGSKGSLLMPVLIGALSALGCALLLSLIISCLVLRSPDPDVLTQPAAYVILALSLICAGVVSSRMAGRNLLACALSGATFALFGLFVHIAVNGSTGILSLLFLLFPLISTLGGLISGPRDKKRGAKFKKRKF
ncbi:MAG: TIGR04086 family membrane protein [Clostridia bacterium]|nr:TIGR04086 family membrane protein [Clostridia bacterium]